ncbi:MAG: galactitol-1-phosphate 5-dehydrogenase [Candidatus Acidiferrales bacterium]
MKALLLSHYNNLEIADFAVPVPAPHEVLVRVAACGICGSDVHGYDGSSGRRIPPIVMGHEAAGTIAALGGSVANFSVNDRVTFDSTVSCGVCSFCARGDVNLCDRREVLGVSCQDYRRAGAFAEFVAVPSHIVYRLPPTISFPEAALLEAVAVAVHAVAQAHTTPGGAALVVGAGTIGLLCLQALRAQGWSRVFIADIDESRLTLARTFGATATLLSDSKLDAEVKRLTNGEGVDLVVEAVGRNESVAASIDAVRKGGTVVLVGNISPEVNLPLQKVVTRQIRLQGSCASAGEYPRAIELLAAGAIDVKPLITAVAPLEDGPGWFKRLHAREPGLTKVVLAPGTSA